jgi:hypothetical protein
VLLALQATLVQLVQQEQQVLLALQAQIQQCLALQARQVTLEQLVR